MEIAESYNELGRKAGLDAVAVHNLASQFRAVYPDKWEEMLTTRLTEDGGTRVQRERIEQKQGRIKQLENQLHARNGNPEVLEKALDARIVDLEKKLRKEESNG